MGRAPCCDKANVKKGPWSPEEDAKLKSYIDQHGTGGNWIVLPQKIGLKRCGKSCRLRWLNYLRPNLKHGGFSEEEDNIICSLYISIGSRWSIIAAQLPGRTDNDIKNYWNTRLKKKLLGKPQLKEKHPGKKKKGISTSSDPNFENPYWPELPPPPPPPPGPRLNDHTSIRKLLIKLGGKFSNEDHRLVPSVAINNGHVLHDQNHQLPSPSLHFHDQPNSSASIHSSGLEEMVSGSNFIDNPQKLDGLEFLLGEDMARVIDESYSGTLCSLVYPPIGYSSGEGLIHYQRCGFERELMRYPGSI